MKTEWLTVAPDPEATAEIARITTCHETVAALLVNRGITTPEEAFKFLNPTLLNLTDPFALKDMKKAVERIYTAICNKEKILIFGDFDADGITSTVLLNDFFCHAEAEVSWYIPHRIREGYSLKPSHIEMAVKQKCDLLITVDCGSDSYDAVKEAIKEDIDVIITDHHEISNSPPPAFAIVNPKQKDCNAALDHLAGVGVAFYLVIALRNHLRQQGFWEEISEPNLMAYSDLFAIGTIADMVPLKGDNRTLSKAGIEMIRQCRREGIRALIQASKIEQSTIDSDDISFKIAPRINAAGRISHSRICVDLLTEKKRGKAEQSAFILEELNKKRQESEKRVVDDIERIILLNPELIKQSSIVMEDATWSGGVIGIAASRISKKYCRPVVLISTSATSATAQGALTTPSMTATGSGRSIGKINIHEVLSNCSDLLENFGGHIMAAGISIKPENIKKFSDRFEEQVSKVATPEDFISQITIDANLQIDEITESLVDEIDLLRPFGTDNPEPLFQCSDVKVISSFMVGSKHRKMVLKQMNRSIEAMQFNIVQKEGEKMPDHFEKIAFRIRMNRFHGKKKAQIVIEHTLDRDDNRASGKDEGVESDNKRPSKTALPSDFTVSF